MICDALPMVLISKNLVGASNAFVYQMVSKAACANRIRPRMRAVVKR